LCDRQRRKAERGLYVGRQLVSLVLHLVPRVAQDDVTGPAEREIASPVALDAGGCGVGTMAVELNDHSLIAPEGVDLVAFDDHVDLWDRDGVGFAEQDERVFEGAVGAGELREVVVPGLFQLRAPAMAATGGRVELLIGYEPPIVGFGEGLPQLAQGRGRGEVEERLGNGGDWEAAVGGLVESPRVMDANCGYRGATTGSGYVDRHGLVEDQLPPPGC
jgi:hypothetical protein